MDMGYTRFRLDWGGADDWVVGGVGDGADERTATGSGQWAGLA